MIKKTLKQMAGWMLACALVLLATKDLCQGAWQVCIVIFAFGYLFETCGLPTEYGMFLAIVLSVTLAIASHIIFLL